MWGGGGGSLMVMHDMCHKGVIQPYLDCYVMVMVMIDVVYVTYM